MDKIEIARINWNDLLGLKEKQKIINTIRREMYPMDYSLGLTARFNKLSPRVRYAIANELERMGEKVK